MDEYIKRTDAYNAILDELVGTGYQSGALRAIEFIPTADVAPRAEVAREIILEVDALICCHANGDIDDKRLYTMFDELKNKYTEDKNT